MSIRNRLNNAFAMLSEERYDDAAAAFTEIWHTPGVAVMDRYRALKGLTRAMDGQGRWHKSETVFEDGFRQLQEQAKNDRRNRWILNGIAVGLITIALTVAHD